MVENKLPDINIVKNSDKGVLAFRNPHIESKWTKGDVFKHFNCLDNENIYNTRQFTANRIIIKKNAHLNPGINIIAFNSKVTIERKAKTLSLKLILCLITFKFIRIHR